jgi:hypothetical protein
MLTHLGVVLPSTDFPADDGATHRHAGSRLVRHQGPGIPTGGIIPPEHPADTIIHPIVSVSGRHPLG